MNYPVEFSAIISCLNEEKSIDEFYGRLSSTLESTGRSYEIIFVNDGSTDGTWDKLQEIHRNDEHVSVIMDLSRNVGQANAKTPGVMAARGRAFILLDSDLQLDPEDLPTLIAQYDAGHDIVTGYRENRRDSWSRKLPSKIANLIMRRASQSDMRDFGCTFKIYDGALVRAFDFGPFKPWRAVPVIAMAGRISEVPVNHHPRKYGKSGWTFRKLFAYNMENIVNMSEVPFQVIGGLCAVLASLFFLRIVLARLLNVSVLAQVTEGLILNVIVFSFLALFALMCVVGEFVIRNFMILQARPAFAVRDRYSHLSD